MKLRRHLKISAVSSLVTVIFAIVFKELGFNAIVTYSVAMALGIVGGMISSSNR